MKFLFFILFSLVMIPAAFSQQQFSVYFDSNKFDLAPKERASLDNWIKANASIKIVGIYGFTDEDGTNGFNDTLSKKRIDFIYSAIKDKVKIREDFKARSFGELHQLSKIKAENRKVTLFYIEAKDIPRENEILGITASAPKTEFKGKAVIQYPEKMVFENPDGTKSEFKLNVAFMQKMSAAPVGEKLKIEDLNFQINTYIVIPASRGKLYELLVVLKDNPAMKIEIQGHLCCQPVDRLDLSTQRAKAIKNFLIANGIDEKRLTYKGFGSSQPIYPLPENDETERAANRRVEIMIIAN